MDNRSRDIGPLIDKFGKRLYVYAVSLLNSREDAEEVVQDVFFRFYRWGAFKEDMPPFPYLMKIASNLIRERMHKGRIDASLPEDAGDIAEFNETPEAVFEKKLENEAISSAVSSLPLIYKEALVLRYMEGMRYKEIADVLDLTEETVEIRIFRAKRLLREKLLRKGFNDEL